MSQRLPTFRAASFARALVATTLLATAGCSSFERPSVPAPAGAIAAALIGHDQVAILAGSEDAKAVFLMELKDGIVRKSFGVTKEATGIEVEGYDGPLLVSVAGVANGRNVGAIERWSVSGAKLRVVPMPSQALGITHTLDGVSYVLLSAADGTRAAIPVNSPSLLAGRPVPLEAGARELQLCKFGVALYLVYTSDAGFVSARALDSGVMSRSTVGGESPECSDDGHIYAISKGFASRSVIALDGASMNEVGSIPVSNGATALYDMGNHMLLELDATARVSSLEVLPEPAIVKTAAR